MERTAAQIADMVKGSLYGNADYVVSDVASAEKAGPSNVTFARGIYMEHINEFRAGIILVDELPASYDHEKNLIVCDDARRAFGELVEFFHPEPHYEPGIHPTAVISPKARIDPTATIMAYCVIDDEAVIGAHTVLFPYVYVGRNARIGENCEINPGAVIHENSVLGNRVVLRAHAVIGGQGFGFSTDEQGHHTHIRQLGKAVLGDDVEVGACSTVDNAAMDSTVVGRGTKIDNLVHLGHNVEVGEDCFLCAQVGIAGSTTVGSHCILAGQVGVNGHIHITDNVIMGGKTGVIGSIDKPGTYVGYPALPHGEWGRTQVMITKLPELRKKIRQLEKLVNSK